MTREGRVSTITASFVNIVHILGRGFLSTSCLRDLKQIVHIRLPKIIEEPYDHEMVHHVQGLQIHASPAHSVQVCLVDLVKGGADNT